MNLAMENFSYPWQFLKYHQQETEVGSEHPPFMLAISFLKSQLFLCRGSETIVLEKIQLECEAAAKGRFENIRKDESLIQQLRLAAQNYFMYTDVV